MAQSETSDFPVGLPFSFSRLLVNQTILNTNLKPSPRQKFPKQHSSFITHIIVIFSNLPSSELPIYFPDQILSKKTCFSVF